MPETKDNSLFYTCSLIEFIGREQKIERREVVDQLGQETIEHIFDYADVLHCEPIKKVANEYIEKCNIVPGQYDNVSDCKYTVPSYWDIGKVYSRLISDLFEEQEYVKGLWQVYHSWISDLLSDYNTDFYYQSRGYIAECYRQNKVLS